jgi:hypothetical protein
MTNSQIHQVSTASREIAIDITELKKNYSVESKTEDGNLDYMMEYLENYKKMCQRRRDAYNLHSVRMRHKHNIVSIPLLVVTSATGVLAGLNMDRVLVTCLGASSAILTAVQRFCSYAERAENSRMIAKGYSKITRRIEDINLYIKSPASVVDITYFTKQVEDVLKEFDAVNQLAHEVPWELLQYINTVDASVWCFYPVFGTKKQVPKIPEIFG